MRGPFTFRHTRHRSEYPDEDGKRRIAKFLEEAERVQELQEEVSKSKNPAAEPALRELFLIQAPSLMHIPNERAAAELFDSQTGAGRSVLMGLVLEENRALAGLRAACSGIPPSPREPL